MASDEEDFVFVGTPIEREEDAISRKKKAVAEASGQLRSLVPWKQEVRDDEGRRRFHGAFTGGFSAGYYNTAGSKEGWKPQTFTSSRKNRAEIKQQSVLNFLDEDEKTEMESHHLGTSSQFDTFGFTANEAARKQAEKEQSQRPSAIPGPVPDELVVPAAESIGVKLLLKMGWRHGRAIKDKHANSLYDVRREARKALLALSSDGSRADLAEKKHGGNDVDADQPLNDVVRSFQSTPVYVRHPKQDLHGLGFDPFKNAPEFREKKRLQLSETKDIGGIRPFYMKDDHFSKLSRKMAPGFGIGALEDLDVEDEDVYTAGYDFEEIDVQGDDEPSKLMIANEQSVHNSRRLDEKQPDGLPGFKVSLKADYQSQRFDPPVVPEGFVPYHKFNTPHLDHKIVDIPPPEVSPPQDNSVRLLIEGVATLVARCGKIFEDLSREKNRSNPLFSFLMGGEGHDYYARRLWEEQQKHCNRNKLLLDGKLYSDVQKMTAESRGKLLGERPLERSIKDPDAGIASATDTQKQLNLSDNFTTPESFDELLETAKPFKDDPAKQERFEQFLKDKYQGGLRSTYSGGASNMSEAARARERLDFEAAAEAIAKAKRVNHGKSPAQLYSELMTSTGLQFTSGGVEQVGLAEDMTSKSMYPKREEFQWRPAALLCKRFEISDPYMGKPPPPPRARSKMDSFIFAPDAVTGPKLQEMVTDSGRSTVFDVQEESVRKKNGENVAAVEVENVERPIDLYKAIFSDESDDEGESPNVNHGQEDPQKKIEAANTALSRLMAGDFLESLGKELGLEVPPEAPIATNKSHSYAPQKEAADANGRFMHSNARDNVESSNLVNTKSNDTRHGIATDGVMNVLSGHNQRKPGNIESGKLAGEDQIGERSYQHADKNNSSPSGDEKSRKHSKRNRQKTRGSDSDSSDDAEDQHYSRSRERRKREKRRRRKHSKHERERDHSPVRSSRHGRERDHSESRRERRKY